MSETGKHTPGPFRIGMVTDGNGLQSCNEAFVTVGSPEGQDDDDCEIIIKEAHVHEVARLIATALNMLVALKATLPHIDNGDSPSGCDGTQKECSHCEAIRLTRAALSKATGTP